MTDQPLGEPNADTDDAAPSPLLSAAETKRVENFLTLDAVLSSARRVQRTARICLRGDLENAYNGKIAELSTLVDADGELLSEEGESALGDAARAEVLEHEALALHREMQKHTFSVLFEAMPDDDWDTFEGKHRNPTTNKVRDLRKYHNELIAKCAIKPELTVDDVRQLRGELNANQMLSLSNEAYWANTTGGLDIPKLPAFSHFPSPAQ